MRAAAKLDECGTAQQSGIDERTLIALAPTSTTTITTNMENSKLHATTTTTY